MKQLELYDNIQWSCSIKDNTIYHYMYVNDKHTYTLIFREKNDSVEMSILRIFRFPLKKYSDYESEYACNNSDWTDRTIEEAKQICEIDYKNGTWKEAKRLNTVRYVLNL